jgi:hypothetical protein
MNGRPRKALNPTEMTSDDKYLSLREYALMLSVALSAAAHAAPPPPGSPAQAPPPAQSLKPPAVPAPDDSLFEFLGSDDVGDARWWDYLMKTAPRTQVPPRAQAPPPAASQAPAQEADK